jgi:outer membrane lipoprotein-sorting protein
MPHMGYEGRTVHFDWHNQRPEAYGYKFKSKQEYRWATYLSIICRTGNVEWKYEPKTFEAKKMRWKKLRTYTPDFRVEDDSGSVEWHEVKTSLRQKDVTRFKWFRADYPEERIILVLNSCPTRSVKQKILLDNARKYVDDVIFAGPILRKLGI